MNLPLVVDSQGEKTNPTTSTVLADTGALTYPGVYEFLVVASASAAAQMQVQHRNVANDAVVSDACGFYLAASAPAEFRGRFFINTSERIRVMMDDNLTGTAFVNIFAWRVE